MFSATKLQVATYLLGVCPFSIAFLVFLNSSVSFVITDLIGQEQSVGDAVGTLGFADELVALFACPLWGLLSDRIGVRYVCVTGYLIICFALVLFVQARHVYPDLLLGRLLFSIGGSAASTMVTAVLPTVSQRPTASIPGQTSGSLDGAQPRAGISHAASPSLTSELTITPARFLSNESQRKNESRNPSNSSTYASSLRVAGFVGMFTGCGALLALLVFLPLPARFQKIGADPEHALQYSFYIVAVVAFILAIWCLIGLQNLDLEDLDKSTAGHRIAGTTIFSKARLVSVWRNISVALSAGFYHSDIALGYLGGFVARASSVAISLFIPLLVNAMFLSSDLCKIDALKDSPQGLPDIKRKCPKAYILAAELTGISQMVALLAAPIFGYVSARVQRRGLPLMIASAAGILGYPLFATQFDPDSQQIEKRVATFISAVLIGISQIGAIVCSLGLLSSGVLSASDNGEEVSPVPTQQSGEHDALLGETEPSKKCTTPLSSMKGSIAGIYSFYGGAAILLLTKAGGLLFDKVSLGAPFYIMAGFNGLLMVACGFLGLRKHK